MKQFYLIMIISLMTVSLTSCINEKLENCQTNHYLTFEYSKNKENVNKFPSQVNTLDIFVFDMNGKFIKHLSDQGTHLSLQSYSLPVDLPEGIYTFVVWGGSRTDYRIYEKINTEESSLTFFQSIFYHSKLSLKDTASSNNGYPENLFFGMAEEVKITENGGGKTHFNLIKNTNTINVTIKGIQNIYGKNSFDHIDFICNAANGEYNFDNSISNQEKLIDYLPTSKTNSNEDLYFVFKTLRLKTGMNSHLIIKDNNTKREIFNENLIQLLLLLPDINDDNDLDINDEYNIVISFNTNQGIVVTINGYVVIDNELEI